MQVFITYYSVRGEDCVLLCQFVQRVLLVFMPAKYQPDYIYLRHVKTFRVHIFTAIQTFCSIVMWFIKSIKATSIIFPLMVIYYTLPVCIRMGNPVSISHGNLLVIGLDMTGMRGNGNGKPIPADFHTVLLSCGQLAKRQSEQ